MQYIARPSFLRHFQINSEIPFLFQQSIHQWQLVFYINVAAGAVGWLLFMVMASGERQQWDMEVVSSEERDYLIQDDDEQGEDNYRPISERI
jgi:hypothetical protein